MFLDHADLNVKSGKGGSGALSFRHEKYVPKGGPDGGDGGRGGHVYLVADKNMNTLIDFHFQRKFIAGDGTGGGGSQMHGRNGEDLYLKIPAGTIVRDAVTGTVLRDMVEDGDTLLVARGGRGGRGNIKFKNATRQAPRFYEKGEPEEEKKVILELKILADVGIIGMANAGKSTLLSKISNARPKIANYPFTTLVPVLGLVRTANNEVFVAADIPGLIEGASEGKGLGFDFLKHIERTKVYIHVIDPTQGDAYENYKMINNELKAYTKELAKRPQIAVVNKVDLLTEDEIKDIKKKFKAKKIPVLFVSAGKGIGLDEVVVKAHEIFKGLPPDKPMELEKIMYEPPEPLEIEMVDDGVYRLKSRKNERYVQMLDFKENETLEVFRRHLDKSGLSALFKEKGIKQGDVIIIGDFDFVFEDEEGGGPE
jgi:GTP-binding protein